MKASLQTTLESLLPKVETLGAQREELRERLKQSEATVDALRQELKEMQKQLDASRQECEFLRMSHRLADNPDALAETRRHISRLIRRLDASINLLEDDPAL